MDGVRVISSVAVLLFVLLASFSAAREERSPRRGSTGWTPLVSDDQTTYNYLALLKHENAPKCAGSIPSKWTVLTYCADASADGKTKAYAGMLTVANAVPTTDGVQERIVKNFVADNTLVDLKLCILTEIWDLQGTVGSIQLSASEQETSCTVLGFRAPAAFRGEEEKRVAHKQSVTLVPSNDENCEGIGAGVLGSKVATAANEKLDGLDFGGPLVCSGKQFGISKEYKSTTATKLCNLYIAIADHSDWIEKAIQAADPEAPAGPDGPGGTGGTGGNGTASSGYSIHSHLNKYSNWKVLWFLVPPIVAFLQY